MSDYAKKKNDELAALCKERGLPHTGKKAELVKRLEDHDDSASKDEPEENTTAPAASTEDKGSAKQNGAEAAGPSDETIKKDEQKSGEVTEEKPAQEFRLGLQDRTLDEEIEKRKKRAEKFGLDPKQDETLKQLERAQRFGTTNLPGLLNQALPERAEKHSKKRGREATGDSKDNRKRSRQRTGKEENADKPPTKSRGDVQAPTWMTDKDREAAERRKARFGATKE